MTTTETKHHVHLWGLHTPALIAEAATGVIYQNQTGCVACRHNEAEGFLIPLPVSRPSALDCDPQLAAVEKEIRHVCKQFETVREFRALPHEDNTEAWIRCSFESLHSFDMGGPNDEWRSYMGWLTWENCD